ncbi:MAG TPA: HAD family hydrolase [Bacteroidales bacterium]|jgi:histidinol-phosphate phosphatase family domain/HAD-superfamily hydrolase, subfamily IIIA
MNKAIFLDRDGVVNVERGEYTWRIEDFKLTIGLIDFIKAVQKQGFLVIVISNQGGIGKGVYTMDDVEKAHRYLQDELKKENIELTDIYYCPHHPKAGKCLCRKPESIMLEKAIARYQVDIKNSYFIGDTERDIEAGNRVGLTTIKINPNDNLNAYIGNIRN